jgi:hypothetical protein
MTTKPNIFLLVTEPVFGFEDTMVEIPLDARISTNHSFNSTVTEFPVEAGAVISDHVHLRPDALTIEGFVSDAPLTLSTLPGQLKGDAGQLQSATRSQEAFDVLKAVRRQKLPITVVDRLDTYEDMVIERLDIPHSRDRSTGLWFTMGLRRIDTVQTMVGTLPPDVIAALKRKSAKAQYEKIKKKAGEQIADLQKKLEEQLAPLSEQGAQETKKTATEKPWEKWGMTEQQYNDNPWKPA